MKKKTKIWHAKQWIQWNFQSKFQDTKKWNTVVECVRVVASRGLVWLLFCKQMKMMKLNRDVIVYNNKQQSTVFFLMPSELSGNKPKTMATTDKKKICWRLGVETAQATAKQNCEIVLAKRETDRERGRTKREKLLWQKSMSQFFLSFLHFQFS